MTNLDDILKTLAIYTAVFVSIGGLLAAILEVFGKLRQVVEILKPNIKLLAFLGTQIIPNGIAVWFLLYIAAQNSDRLTEPVVFLSLVAQATIAISAYALVWGIWLYPKLRFLLVKQERNTQQLSGSKQTNTNDKQKTNIKSPSEYQ